MLYMTKREQAYEQLRDAITFGELNPGEKLVEVDICEKFQIGRTPLREALRQLQAEGYLVVYPNKGATIRKISIEEVEHVHDILAVLEGYAVEIATGNISEQDMKNLRNIGNDLKEAAKTKNHNNWIDLNMRFHEYFWRVSGNPVLLDDIKRLRNRIYRSRGLIATFNGNADKYINEHEAILSMVSQGDAIGAGEAMKAHLRARKEILSYFLRENPLL